MTPESDEILWDLRSDEDYRQSRRRNIDNGIIVDKGYGSVAFTMPYFAEYPRGNEDLACSRIGSY